MANPGAFQLYELRYILQAAGARSAAFTVADNAAWAAGTATCPRVFDFEMTLTEEEVKDTSAQTAFEGNPAHLEARKIGSFKFKQWLEGGSGTTTATTLATLLGSGACFGGLRNPTAISDLAEASTTATTIKATSHGMEENELILAGSANDSGGDGRVSAINDASNANEYTLQLALPGAPAEGATIKNGHTIYMDPSVEQYADFLFIGSHAGGGATDDPDQVQMIGCACSSIGFGGLGKGERPFVEMEWQASDWQWVNDGDKATVSHTQSKAGADPVSSSAGGSVVIQDAGTTTRNAIACDELEVVWTWNLVPVVDHNYTNDMGGFVKHPAGPPVIRFTAYWAKLADMPGLYNDSTGTKQAKQVLVQLGRVAQGTVAWYMQRAFLAPIDPTKRKELEQSTGLSLEFRGDTGRATALSSDALKLEDAAMVMGML